jgi:glycosyltransferase involved in cell wall biosynthesis
MDRLPAEEPGTAMRILWLSHFVPWPLRLGAAIRSYHLIEALAREHEVSFLGLCQRSLAPQSAVEEARAALARSCARVELLPIPSERGPLHRHRILARSLLGRSYDEVWLSSRELGRALVREQTRFGPDAVHLDTLGLLQHVQTSPPVPVVMNHHNVESQMMWRRAEKSRFQPAAWLLRGQARRLEQLERRAAERCAVHLTVSGLDAERLRAVAPAVRTHVVPNGVDVGYFDGRRSSAQIAPHSMVFVGGMDWYPNRDAVGWFLENVFPAVKSAFPSATFTVVGRGSQAIERKSDGVLGTGEVADIRPFVARSAVFVCPIRDGGGTRLKVLDALAQRIPLIATPLAVEGIDVRDGDQAVLAETGPTFAAGIKRLFENPAAGQMMADRGREFVEREFSWQRVGRELLHAYALVHSDPRAVSK